MLNTAYLRGRFSFRKNCSLIHFIPEGKTIDGFPVIIFPREPSKVVENKLYEFLSQTTLDATYVIDEKGSKITYRVAHAIDLRAVDGSEGDMIDQILHRSVGVKRTTLSESLPGNTRSELEALKARLAGKKPVWEKDESDDAWQTRYIS